MLAEECGHQPGDGRRHGPVVEYVVEQQLQRPRLQQIGSRFAQHAEKGKRQEGSIRLDKSHHSKKHGYGQ